MKPTIIGLCGRAGSGKSSVARHLVEFHKAQVVSFAEPLKFMAMGIWGFSEEQVFGEADIKEAPDPRTGIAPRWAMQKLGQAARDHLGVHIWTERALSRITGGGIWVIEDVRYLNEAEAISQQQGGRVFRLHCSDSVSKDAGDHPSEREVDLIPKKYITAELVSSRKQGLAHLFSLVDQVMARVRSPL